MALSFQSVHNSFVYKPYLSLLCLSLSSLHQLLFVFDLKFISQFKTFTTKKIWCTIKLILFTAHISGTFDIWPYIQIHMVLKNEKILLLWMKQYSNHQSFDVETVVYKDFVYFEQDRIIVKILWLACSGSDSLSFLVVDTTDW